MVLPNLPHKRIFALTTLITFLLIGTAEAQMLVGTTKWGGWILAKVKSEQMDALLKTKTVYFYTPKEKQMILENQAVLQSSWGLTPLIFAPISEAPIYYQSISQYSFLSRRSLIKLHGPQVIDIVSRLSLHLSYKGKDQEIAYLYLSPLKSEKEFAKETWCSNLSRADDPEKLLDQAVDYLNKEAEMHNFNPHYLAFYLKSLRANIDVGKRLRLETRIFDYATLASLKTRTLIFPQEMEDLTKGSLEDLFSTYKFPYKILPTNKILEMVENPELHPDVLLAIPSSAYTIKSLNIYTFEGELVLQFVKGGFTFFDEHMELLAAEIEYAAEETQKLAISTQSE